MRLATLGLVNIDTVPLREGFPKKMEESVNTFQFGLHPPLVTQNCYSLAKTGKKKIKITIVMSNLNEKRFQNSMLGSKLRPCKVGIVNGWILPIG